MLSHYNFDNEDNEQFIFIQPFNSIEVGHHQEHYVGVEAPFSSGEVFDDSYTGVQSMDSDSLEQDAIFLFANVNLTEGLFAYNANEMYKGYKKTTWDSLASKPEIEWKPPDSSRPTLSYEDGSVAKIERLENRVQVLELQSAYIQGKIEAYENLLAPAVVIVAMAIRHWKLRKHFKAVIQTVKKLK